jgi:hypothetical protein
MASYFYKWLCNTELSLLITNLVKVGRQARIGPTCTLCERAVLSALPKLGSGRRPQLVLRCYSQIELCSNHFFCALCIHWKRRLGARLAILEVMAQAFCLVDECFQIRKVKEEARLRTTRAMAS